MSTQSRTPARVSKGVPTGGQFAASAHAESGVSLDLDGPAPLPAYDGSPDMDMLLDDARLRDPALAHLLEALAETHHEHPSAPACDGATNLRDWTEAGFYRPVPDRSTPLGAAFADALDDGTLPGYVEMTGAESLTYTDERGDSYAVSIEGGRLQVRAEETSATILTMPFMRSNAMTPAEALDGVRDAQYLAADIRAFTGAVSDFAANDGDEEDEDRQHMLTTSIDESDGDARFDGVTIHGFTRNDPDLRGPSLLVEISDYGTRTPPVEYRIARDRDGSPRYVRGDNFAKPLAAWEQQALDTEVARRIGRNGPVRSLSGLLNDADRRAEKDAPTPGLDLGADR